VRVRGLKQFQNWKPENFNTSHPVRVRGLKPLLPRSRKFFIRVAPRAGAWVETANFWGDLTSPPFVAPRAGAWVETELILQKMEESQVAPRAGAWVETDREQTERIAAGGRTPCGCVG